MVSVTTSIPQTSASRGHNAFSWYYVDFIVRFLLKLKYIALSTMQFFYFAFVLFYLSIFKCYFFFLFLSVAFYCMTMFLFEAH
jgi:hypothetical protein